jgi:hypothetical protein
MTPKLLRIVAIAAAAQVAHVSAADEWWSGSVSFSGFGTLGVVRSSERNADYLVDAFKPTGPGFTRAWSADVDSHLAGQVTLKLTERLTGVVQVMVQQRYDDTYRPSVEWANLKFDVTPDFSVRAGRTVLPVFMVTDSRKVGYANPWVRPPVEVYGLVPVTNSDGVDASFRWPLGAFTDTVQLTYGRSDSKFPLPSGGGTGDANAREILAVVNTIEHGFTTLRLNYGRARLTIEAFDPLFDAFRQFGPAGAAIADRYGVRDKEATFLGLGASYDPGPWFAMGEWARFDTRSVVGKRSAWYVSGGPRFGRFTPYATYARVKNENNTSDPGLTLAGLPPQLAAVAGALNAALNAQLAVAAGQRTWSLGVRWDMLRNAALKAQYDRVKRDEGSTGSFGNIQPGFQSGGSANIFSVAADFVF